MCFRQKTLKTYTNHRFLIQIRNFVSFKYVAFYATVDADKQGDKACFKRLAGQEHKAERNTSEFTVLSVANSFSFFFDFRAQKTLVIFDKFQFF